MYNEISCDVYYRRSNDVFDTDVSKIQDLYEVHFDRNLSNKDYIIVGKSCHIYKALDEWYYVKKGLSDHTRRIKYYKCDQMEGLLKLLTCIMK